MSDDLELGMFQSTPGELIAKKPDQTGCPVTGMAAEFEPFGDAYIANPFEFFRRARNEEPVFYDPKSDYWVVLNYDDIVDIFRNPEIFSAALARHPVTPLCPASPFFSDDA